MLAIGGINVPVKVNSVRGSLVDVGGMAKAYSGKSRMSRLTQKRTLEFETTPLTMDEAQAWESLLTGNGMALTFDSNMYTSTGEPTLDNVGGWAVDATQEYFDLSGDLDSGNDNRIGHGYGQVRWGNLNFSLEEGFSIIMWRASFGGADITEMGTEAEHWIIRSDGKVYRSGILAGSSGVVSVYPNEVWLDYSPGGILALDTEAALIGAGLAVRANTTGYALDDLVLGNAGAAIGGAGSIYYFKCTDNGTSGGAPPTWDTTIGNVTIDGTVQWTCWGVARSIVYDLAFVRGLAPAQWGIDAAANPNVFGALPEIRVTGDLVPGGEMTMLGATESQTILGNKGDGNGYQPLVQLSVKLTEV